MNEEFAKGMGFILIILAACAVGILMGCHATEEGFCKEASDKNIILYHCK